jgi:2-amino-4-hydroxy-6-hydroxymethyldihydropteridine diphosphokinase
LRAYLGLGANLGDPAGQIEAALRAVDTLPATRLITRSALYRSEPLGPAGQPDYCNAVCAIDTALAPLALLDALQAVEHAAGRLRGAERWSARTLDLDILHLEGLLVDEARLRLPHPELARRNWVLLPLAEIAPELLIPGIGRVAELAEAIGTRGLQRW